MNTRACWLETIDYDEATSSLRRIYDAVRGPNGQLDNLYQAFSLRPHTIRPADDLYRAVLHHEENTLPRRFSELLGTYVAVLTGCRYAKTHHGQNFIVLSGDEDKASRLLAEMERGELEHCGSEREVAALCYAKKLCNAPESMEQDDVDVLRSLGWSDAEVLEMVQVVAMFSYFCRVINGIGISLGEEKIGLY